LIIQGLQKVHSSSKHGPKEEQVRRLSDRKSSKLHSTRARVQLKQHLMHLLSNMDQNSILLTVSDSRKPLANMLTSGRGKSLERILKIGLSREAHRCLDTFPSRERREEECYRSDCAVAARKNTLQTMDELSQRLQAKDAISWSER
jgi:hypothetical protein